MSLDVVISLPSGKTVLLEHLYKPQFSRLVTTGLDLPHHIRTLLGAKNIRHDTSPCFEFNTETWISFRLKHNTIVAADYVREGSIALSFIKETVLVNIG